MKEMKTGALYIRVSTADQAELSPDAQKRLLLDYAKKNSIVIAKDFIFEESVSGRHAQKRPEFQKMIALAKSKDHPIDIILVWKYSRFARNQEESIVYKSMLKKDAVDVVSVSEPLIDGPFGSLIERIIEWMDEYYSIRLSGEVLRGMKEKALQNGYQATPSLGYNAVGSGKPFVINEEEFKIVEYIMNLYDNENKDPTRIARMCNDLGYKTKRGGDFERRTVTYILQNPFYHGTVSWNGIEFDGSHEVRYTKEQYDARMKLMNARFRPIKSRNVSTCKHWLSGLLKCSICGATLCYTGVRGYKYFSCWKYQKGFHKGTSSIRVEEAERLVIEYFDQILDGLDFDFTYKGPAVTNEDASRRNYLENELSKISTREERVKAAYENEIDTLEEYKANRKRLSDYRKEIMEEIAEMESRKEPDNEAEKKAAALKEIRNVNDILKNPDVGYEEKGMLVRTVIDQIVYDRENNRFFIDIVVS